MIDRILVKSASRMARNTVDLLTLVRELKSIGVTVQFEKEQFDTDSATEEMMLSMMGALRSKALENGYATIIKQLLISRI